MADTWTPSQYDQRVTTQTIPPELMPYANQILSGAMGQMGTWSGDPFAEGSQFTFNPYQAYSGDRLADPGQLQTQAWQGLGSLTSPSQFQTATNTATGIATMPSPFYNANSFYSSYNPQAFGGTYNPTNFNYGYNPTAFTGNYQATNYNMPGSNLTNWQAGTFTSGYDPNMISANQWDTQQMNNYMDPYMQGVVGVAQRDAMLDQIRQANQLNTRATQQGAFGGSRNALEGMESQRIANQRYDDLALKGMSQAYQSALQAFGGDRDAALKAAIENENNRYRAGSLGLEAQKLGEQSRQFGGTLGLDAYRAGLQAQQYGDLSKQFGATYGLQSWQAQQDAAQRAAAGALEAQKYGDASRQFGATYGLQGYQATQDAMKDAATLGLEAQRMGEQSRQFGADYGLRGLTTQLQAGEQLAKLGVASQQDQINRLREMERAGALQQAQDQSSMDLAYQDYLTQQQYPYKQLEWYNNILRGIPSGGDYASTAARYTPPPSIYSQLGGLGLGSLALWNAFGGSGTKQS